MTRTADRRLTTADVAKLIRAALKQAYPHTAFSVRTSSYSGGSSISIRWTDGPSVANVEAIAGDYQGRGFDGSIDLGYSIDAWMLNGKIIGTRSNGTAGSRGSVPAWGLIPPHDDAELVDLPSCFVHCTRQYSAEKLRAAVDAVAALWRLEAPEVRETPSWGAHVDATAAQDRAACGATSRYWAQLVSEHIRQTEAQTIDNVVTA
jgi:hypothetical protein